MITKQQFVASLAHETNIIKHLASKLDWDALSYRPQEGMRSTLELLQYLTTCAVVTTRGAVTGNWDHIDSYRENSKKLGQKDIADALDRQLAEISELMEIVDDGAFLTRKVNFPWGVSDVLGIGLVNGPLKFLTAYRMQLFIYLKLLGRAELNTMNCWAGVDAPMRRP